MDGNGRCSWGTRSGGRLDRVHCCEDVGAEWEARVGGASPATSRVFNRNLWEYVEEEEETKGSVPGSKRGQQYMCISRLTGFPCQPIGLRRATIPGLYHYLLPLYVFDTLLKPCKHHLINSIILAIIHYCILLFPAASSLPAYVEITHSQLMHTLHRL